MGYKIGPLRIRTFTVPTNEKHQNSIYLCPRSFRVCISFDEIQFGLASVIVYQIRLEHQTTFSKICCYKMAEVVMASDGNGLIAEMKLAYKKHQALEAKKNI